MANESHSISNPNGAAWISAAFLVLIVLGWMTMGRVAAQGPTRLQGQLTNGTRGAPPESVSNVSVTLFQITAAGPVTQTVTTDAQGRFVFEDVLSDANNYFVRVDYAGIRYYSPIQPVALAAASPISLTVFETQTLPADFTIDRAHFVFDVQPRRLEGFILLQVTNPTDRAFFMPLPMPSGARDLAFEDVREQTRVIRADDGTILYPILPTATEVLYSVSLATTTPEYELHVPLRTNIANINLLVSRLGDVRVSGSGLMAGAPFNSQSGQSYLVYSAGEQRAGTTFRATISNLPGLDHTGTIQTMILVGGGLGALALLAYPLYRRRVKAPGDRAASARLARLQRIAELDDAFAEGKIDEQEYYATRAALKAELLKESVHKAQGVPGTDD